MRACVLLTPLVLLGLTSPAAAAPYRAPRTSWGAPDLEGVWTPQTSTPLERPAAYAGLTATPAELAAARARRAARRAASGPPAPGDVGQEGSEFGDTGVAPLRIDGQERTSLITDPPDGRLPYTAEGRRLAEAAAAPDPQALDDPERRPASERCLAAPNGQAGPPILSGPDDANVQIIETRTEVGLLSEMIHDLRLVRLDGRHPATGAHPVMGDGVGRWEGETLVIETVDQSPLTAAREVGGRVFWLSPRGRVVERLRRVSPTEILYRFTVEDPGVYTRPWTGETLLRRVEKPLYEYACHEGNYALANVLSGARAQERSGAAAPQAPPGAQPQPQSGPQPSPGGDRPSI